MSDKTGITIRYLDLFSGVGGFRFGIESACKELDIKCSCVGFSEIDKYAIKTYEKNFKKDEGEAEIGDITKLDTKKTINKKINDFDMLFAGFPCQPFSLMGAQNGFADTRGTLFFHIEKILSVKKPQFFILENVRRLKTHDNGKTFEVIMNILEKKLGYHVRSEVFNSHDFGVPQVRRRLYFIGCKNKKVFKEIENLDFSYKSDKKYKTTHDLLEKKVDKKYYLSSKLLKTILSNGTGGYKSKSEINQVIARPLTATMHKMHRACQDNYYSDDFILNKQTESSMVKTKQKIRKITPIEAFRLQGFPDNLVINAKKVDISDTQLYRQAGNAITVNVVETILSEIFKQTSLLSLIN